MNKTEFMDQLAKKIRYLPKEDQEDALQYYREYLEEMEADADADVTAVLGQPAEVASAIISECTQKRIEVQKKEGGMKSSAMVIWMVILGILASPLAIPLVIVILTLLFSFICVLFSLVLAAFCAGVGGIFSGGVLFVCAFTAGAIPQWLVCCGMGLLLLAGGILILLAAIKFSELCIRLVAWLFKKIFMRKRYKNSKKEDVVDE